MNHYRTFVMLWTFTVAVVSGADSADVIAHTVLTKAGIRSGVCELPRAGDGLLAAALAKAGVAVVHGIAPDEAAVEIARRPAATAGLLGSKVIIETGRPDELPLGDWVADLYAVSDATDLNLTKLDAAEAGRVLSPYRGVAVIGNPDGAKAGLSRASLEVWARGTGGSVTIQEDASGLWAAVRMPALTGGDDWGHYFHGPDAVATSQDTSFKSNRYQLLWHDLPIEGERNYTMVASAGRMFVATSTLYSGGMHTWLRPQVPYELEARSLANAKLLWRRPLSGTFGDMGSLMVATPDRLYVKDGDGVQVLDPEFGVELQRMSVAGPSRVVRWLTLADGVLVTCAGVLPFAENHAPARNQGEGDADYDQRVITYWREVGSCQELAAWDAATGKALWQHDEPRIYPYKLAQRDGRVYLYINDSDALALDLHTGKELWRTAAPSTPPRLTGSGMQVSAERRGEMMASATEKNYFIFDSGRRQFVAFDAISGRVAWTLEKGKDFHPDYPPFCPLILGDTYLLRDRAPVDAATGMPVATYPGFKSPAVRPDNCGHSTGVSSGLWIGNGVIDLQTGKQLMPGMDKPGCGTGYFVANGIELMYPNVCNCFFVWSGTYAVRPAPQRALRLGDRFRPGTFVKPGQVLADDKDWPTYRSDDTRKGSSGAEVPATAGIRWIHLPTRPRNPPASELPLHLIGDPAATQSSSVGDNVYFGTAEGAVICLDRKSGTERWRQWTGGAIRATPTWSSGRLYVGSSDGWVTCLDAASGTVCWRYRVAIEDRRLTLLGGLGCPWPVWSSVLVRDGVAYAVGALRGKLDGSTACALDANSGAEIWRKDFEINGDTDAQGNLLNPAPSGGGSLAWHDGKLWWHGGEWGPAIIDPRTGDLKRAISYRACRDFKYALNQDMGILPNGWVVFGGWKPVRSMRTIAGTYQSGALFLRSGPDGLPAGDPADPVLKDTASVPHFLIQNPSGSSRVSRQIPLWDDREAVLPGDFGKQRFPLICQNLSAWLDAQDDAHPWTLAEANKKQTVGVGDLTRPADFSAMPASQAQCAVPPDLAQAIDSKQLTLSGMMVLAKNALVFTAARDDNWPGTELGNWRAIAVDRISHAKLWEVVLPAFPALSGMSLGRDGEVLIPLADGRVICVGSGADDRPVPAVVVPEAIPGLLANDYATDWLERGYTLNWTAADFSILKPLATRVLTETKLAEETAGTANILRAQGYIEVPSDGRYRFIAPGAGCICTLFDPTGQFSEGHFSADQQATDMIYLEKGRHPVELVVLGGNKGRHLCLQWEGPGLPRSEVPPAALSHRPPAR